MSNKLGDGGSTEMIDANTCSLECGCRLTVAKSRVGNKPVAMVNICDKHEEGELYARSSTIQLDGGGDS